MTVQRAVREGLHGPGPRKVVLSPGSPASYCCWHRPVSASLLVLAVIVVLVIYHLTAGQAITYSSRGAGLPGHAFAGAAMGAHDCIPADVMLGGVLGPSGNRSEAPPLPSKSLR